MPVIDIRATCRRSVWPSPAASETGGPVRVAIVDDHILFAEVLGTWLRERVPGYVNAYCGPDPLEALRAAPDLVLLDIDLGPASLATELIVSWFVEGNVPVIVIADEVSGPRLRNALLAGAAGSVAKSGRPEDLVRTITDVVAGNQALTRELAELLCSPGPPRLSQQERCALQLYCTGYPLKSVARQMGVSTSTAKEYLDRVRGKYDAVGRPARTKTELANAARRDGLLDGLV